MSDQNSASAVPPEQPGQPPQLPPPAASAPVAHVQAPAQAAAPVVVKQGGPALWVVAALLGVLVLLSAFIAFKQTVGQPVNINAIVGGPGSGGSTTAPPGAPSGGTVVDATRNGGKLILAEMCTLQSDGTARLISAQVDLKRAQDAIGKNPNSKEAKAFLAKLEESTKSLPPHAVIAEIPASVLPDNVTCDDWKQQRAYQLVLGAPKPQTKKS